MFFIAYTFKEQVHVLTVFAGRVKIVSHSSCRTSAILKYFCPLTGFSALKNCVLHKFDANLSGLEKQCCAQLGCRV